MSQPIDESLYSRSLYVLGHEALKKMSETSVLISGMTGVGAEIAKNLILSGMKSVTIHDADTVQHQDLGANFYLDDSMIGQNRAMACLPRFKSLNSYVEVNAISSILTEEVLSQFTVVVLTHNDESSLLNIGEFCHNNNIKLIVADTRGVTGRIFVDLGPAHTVVDPDGEAVNTYVITDLQSQNNHTIVFLADDHGEKISWSSGDLVTFNGVVGHPELNDQSFETEVLSPFSFRINVTLANTEFKTGYVTPVKSKQVMSFEPWSKQVKKPSLLSYLGSTIDTEVLHLFYSALDVFISQTNRYPAIDSETDCISVMEILANLTSTFDLNVNISDSLRPLLLSLIRISFAELSPVCAVLGGIAAQEVLKACSGKFSPISQYFYYDCVEVLGKDDVPIADRLPINSRYDSQIAVFGKNFQSKLNSVKTFLVGAGAIGCEMLKSMSMMGVACGPNGNVLVTDMDTIEKSNLNRQFLFTFEDIHKPKSEVAAKAAKQMNNDLNITATQVPVGVDTEDVYNDEFFDSIDLIVNALDNVKARLFMDSKAVYYGKPLLESGTLGTKGNVQVVIPHLTKSYGETQDPPEKSVPMCTLKNFPYQIEHTIEWSRQFFEETFTNTVADASKYLKNPSMLYQLRTEGPQAIPTLKNIHHYLVEIKPNSFEDCVKWARLKFEELFNHQIQQLLYMFPPDMLTEGGTPFWSGSKRAPRPIEFDPSNNDHVNFVVFGAKLLGDVYGIHSNINPNQIINLALQVNIPPFVPSSNVQIETEEKQESTTPMQNEQGPSIDEVCNAIPPAEQLSHVMVNPIELDKDKDELGHMDFITACSNLRACNYYIPPADKHRTRGIAGKIVPAMVTTTALVVGLVAIEMYKLVDGRQDLDAYCDSFLNLALPFVARSTPESAPTTEMMGKKFTIWDKLFFDCGDVSLQEFINIFQQTHKLSVCMLTVGNFMVYSEWPPNKEVQARRLATPISKVVEEFQKKPLAKGTKFINMVVLCYNEETGEDVDCPLCVVKIR
ncbi:hypothetical protein P9112_009159 [Eukaryota sp. TZLM1-RC]